MLYELHKLEGVNLPFIFHYNQLQRKTIQNMNWHENLEILFITEGSGKIICDFEATAVECGDIFVVNSNRLHTVESDAELCYYCLIVDTSFCTANGVDPREITFMEKICNDEITQAYKNVVSAFSDTSHLRELKTKTAILSLLLLITEKYVYPPENSQPQSKLFSSIRTAIEYIKANLSSPLSLDEIAAHTGYSRTYFSRKFKALTGYTVVEYINNERCAYARKLLLSGVSVTKCAAEAGFESTSYFTRTYKKIMHKTPASDKGKLTD